jgi:hypothetical protein
MKSLGLNWIFGVLFPGGFGALINSILAGLCLLSILALLLPSIREFVYSKTNIKLPLIIRVIAIVWLFASFGNIINIINKNKQERLAKLRSTDVKTYLSEIKEKRDEAFYLAELKELDATTYKVEMERKEVARQNKLAELKTLLSQAKAASAREKLEIYKRLTTLDPENSSYKEEIEKLTLIVQTQEKKDLDVKLARSNPEKVLEIVNFSWSKKGFGNVMEATFTIKNKASINIKDFKIRCEHSAASGSVIDSNTQTIYDIVQANSTRTFRNVNMGFIHTQAVRSSCSIVSAKSM